RQYSWISELLLQALESRSQGELGDELERMGETVGKALRAQLGQAPGNAGRVEALAALMAGLGYDARPTGDAAEPQIEAQNCVFHKLAFKRPEICRFDLAMMSAATDSDIEHRHCMAQGAACCTFAFRPR
ncbi:MAG TPA: methanogen output domain 1-containing protein, partial [Rhizomicrobium sp.]|nr:methanogen output domain 1-containing protein [Rhizomicrobium sp.]